MGQNSEIVCRIIAHDSAAYREMVALRYRILRQPLGLNFTTEQLAAESEDILIAACAGETIIGSLILTSKSERVMQMRQVAVAEDWQGRGVGKRMVAFAEQTAQERGICEITLHAREAVLPFYAGLGYAGGGETFLEVGLPHREMRKILS